MGRKVASHEWTKRYGYCYDLVLPPDFRDDISATMAADLNRFFGSVYGIKGDLENREVDCLVLSRIPGTKPLKSMGGEPLYTSSDTAFVLRNLPLDNLVMELAQRYHQLATPIVDDTGYRGALDLIIHAPMDNPKAVKQELLKCGLDLSIHKKSISMLVIRPAGPNPIIKTSPTHL